MLGTLALKGFSVGLTLEITDFSLKALHNVPELYHAPYPPELFLGEHMAFILVS